MNKDIKQQLVEVYNELNAKSKQDAGLVEIAEKLRNTLAIPKPDKLKELKLLLNSSEWPYAADPELICDKTSNEDKMSRAEGILEIMVEQTITNKKFLDFGCGEGHISQAAINQKPILSVGYDLKKDKNWDVVNKPTLKMTTDLKEVKKHGPYDIILMYDVVDHAEGDMTKLMSTVYELLDKKGTLYMRCHPWCSKHAPHMYHQINKAYVHLVFSSDELKKMGIAPPENNQKVIYPLATYGKAIKEAGFKVLHHSVIREKVEPFFVENTMIKDRIMKNWENAKKFPHFQLEQQFVDYILGK